ncbi:hypothetical protein [Sporosarcina sp. NPDC096371]|uniref:hypothetical protein n=1 Tax=Sporosarcina sp. NPDC096371 TaxID=3364530 RepID=UPI0037FB93C2
MAEYLCVGDLLFFAVLFHFQIIVIDWYFDWYLVVIDVLFVISLFIYIEKWAGLYVAQF